MHIGGLRVDMLKVYEEDGFFLFVDNNYVDNVEGLFM
jgi:hypothetical protein